MSDQERFDLFSQIYRETPYPGLRYSLSIKASQHCFEKEFRDLSNKKTPFKFIFYALATLTQGVDKSLAEQLKESVKRVGKVTAKDGHFKEFFFRAVDALIESSFLDPKEKVQLLLIAFQTPKEKQTVIQNLVFLRMITSLGHTGCRELKKHMQEESLNLKAVYYDLFNFLMPFEEKVNKEAFEKKFLTSRCPTAIMDYAFTLKNSAFSVSALENLLKFIISVTQGKFHKKRLSVEDNPHLRTIFRHHPSLKKHWKRERKSTLDNYLSTNQQAGSDYEIVETSDPISLLLCGTEVADSCLKVNGSPRYNVALLGYLMNGQNRLIAIRHMGSEKTQIRAMLRLLWDSSEKTPVLFLDKIYPKSTKEEHQKAILAFAIERAHELGLSLVSHEYPSEELYPNLIYSLGGSSPFDYIDGLIGFQENSKYEIFPTYVHFTPNQA